MRAQFGGGHCCFPYCGIWLWFGAYGLISLLLVNYSCSFYLTVIFHLWVCFQSICAHFLCIAFCSWVWFWAFSLVPEIRFVASKLLIRNNIYIYIYVYCVNKYLLNDNKKLLSKHFDMKNLGEASYVLGIEIKRDRSRGLLGLSQQNYISKVFIDFKWRRAHLEICQCQKVTNLTSNNVPKMP